MTSTSPSNTSDPRHHTGNIKRMLNEIQGHVREDTGQVTDPKAQALFEVTAEVLQGLLTAYEHYEQRSETVWKK